MSQELNLNPDEQALEAALAELRPAVPVFDLKRILLATRLRQASRQIWFWRAAAAVLVVTGVLWQPMFRVRERVVEHIVYVPAPEIKTSVVVGATTPWDRRGAADDFSRTNYLSLRDRVLTAGIWALPGHAADGGATTEHDPSGHPPKQWRPFQPEPL